MMFRSRQVVDAQIFSTITFNWNYINYFLSKGHAKNAGNHHEADQDKLKTDTTVVICISCPAYKK